MKLRHITTSIICATLMLTVAGASEDSDIINASNSVESIKSLSEAEPKSVKKLSKVEYNIKVELSDNQPRVSSYFANITNVKEININSKIAKIFKFDTIKKDIVKSSNDSLLSLITLDKKGRSIEYFESGAVFFSNKTLIPENSEDILKLKGLDKKSAKEFYQEKATKFLKEHKLLKEGLEFKNLSFATVQKLNIDDVQNLQKGIKPNKEQRIVGVSANYRYSINGIPTWGPGSELKVYFDKNGVSGYFDQIRTLLSTTKGISHKLISQKEAVERYTSKENVKNLLKTEPIITHRVNVEDAKLVYYMDGVDKEQREIKPHYLISGKLIGEDLDGKEKAVEFQWLESAVTNKF